MDVRACYTLYTGLFRPQDVFLIMDNGGQDRMWLEDSYEDEAKIQLIFS